MFRCKCLLVFVIAVCSNSAVLAKGEPQPQTDQKVTLDVSLSSPVMLADKKRTTYVKVGLTGFALPNSEDRPPVNFVFQTYHIMVAIGMGLIGLCLVGLFMWATGRLFTTRWLLWRRAWTDCA